MSHFVQYVELYWHYKQGAEHFLQLKEIISAKYPEGQAPELTHLPRYKKFEMQLKQKFSFEQLKHKLTQAVHIVEPFWG